MMKTFYSDILSTARRCTANLVGIVTTLLLEFLLTPCIAMAQGGDNAQSRDATKQLNTLLNQNKHARLQAVANEIKMKAQESGDHVMYYYAWRYQIIDLRNQVKLYDALREARAMLQQVNKETGMSKEDRQRVVFMNYEVLGKIFEARGDYENAAKDLNKAIECADDDIKRNGYELSIYNSLARVYRNAEKYDESLKVAEEGLKSAKPKSTTAFKLLQSKAFALYYLGRKKDFMETYHEMKKTFGDKENFDRLNIRKYAYDQNYALAHRLAEKTMEERERTREHLLVYMAQKDWKSAYLCEKKLKEVEMSRLQALSSRDLESLSTKFDVERLRADNYALELENSRTIGIFVLLFVLLVSVSVFIMLRNEKKHVEKLRLANKELAQARDRAEASDRMKTMFVQNISHEIRTPLNAIVGFSDLLTTPGMKVSAEDKREFSETISKNTALLTNMVNDMLELSDLQSGNAKAEMGPCNCNEICRMAIMSAQEEKPKGVEVRFTTDVDDEYFFTTDHLRLSMVLDKFLSNANKHTTEGEIVLDCSKEKRKGYITFTVSDTGCGIPKEKQPNLFHSFEKVDSFQQGAGLGLYICAMIARLLKADIGIDPGYTKGSRFYISLPLE